MPILVRKAGRQEKMIEHANPIPPITTAMPDWMFALITLLSLLIAILVGLIWDKLYERKHGDYLGRKT